MFGYPDETLSLVLDILLNTGSCNRSKSRKHLQFNSSILFMESIYFVFLFCFPNNKCAMYLEVSLFLRPLNMSHSTFDISSLLCFVVFCLLVALFANVDRYY